MNGPQLAPIQNPTDLNAINSTQPITPAPISQQQQQGLPPTGLQQQLNSLNNLYQNVQKANVVNPVSPDERMYYGYDVRQHQFDTAGDQGLDAQLDVGRTSLDSMARNMAQRYGMPIGRGRLVDESGNFLYTPQQIADASGGAMTLGEAAANMNYISQAITKRQNEQQQKLGIAAMQTGLGQVQSRGRGSMASMQSGYYQGIADLYANQEYEAADFSYFIQKEQLEIQQELQRRYEKMVKKQARGMFWSGLAVTAIGLASGNNALAAQGAAGVMQSAGATGYF